jgi:hypothetical protein
MSIESHIEVIYKGNEFGVDLAVEGMFVDTVKKTIVKNLKDSYSAFRGVRIYSDYLTLFHDLERTRQITDKKMPPGKIFFANLVVPTQENYEIEEEEFDLLRNKKRAWSEAADDLKKQVSEWAENIADCGFRSSLNKR